MFIALICFVKTIIDLSTKNVFRKKGHENEKKGSRKVRSKKKPGKRRKKLAKLFGRGGLYRRYDFCVRFFSKNNVAKVLNLIINLLALDWRSQFLATFQKKKKTAFCSRLFFYTFPLIWAVFSNKAFTFYTNLFLRYRNPTLWWYWNFLRIF